MKPIIKYRGGKSKEIPNLIKHIPSFSGRYIEPFFGGGALFFYLEPTSAIINDINDKLIGFYRGVRDNYDTLQKELVDIGGLYARNRKEFEHLKSLSPNSRVEDKNEALYYHIRDMFNGLVPAEYSEAFIYYFINKTAYSGMIRYNSRGEYNVPYGRYKNLTVDSISDAHRKLLSSTEILCGDYGKVFDMATQDDFIFLDPPYDCIFSDYGNEEYRGGFGEKSHRELAGKFKELRCPALMVIGRTPLTEELYGDMIVDEYNKEYAVNIRNRFHSSASHILIANY